MKYRAFELQPRLSSEVAAYLERESPLCRHAVRAPVAHRAQITSSGWKSKRTSRATFESSPNASRPSTNCQMFPGKITTKNAAVTHPTSGRHLLGAARSALPSTSSHTPETKMTNSGAGIHGGTCARNSLVDTKCPSPATIKNIPNPRRPIAVSMYQVCHHLAFDRSWLAKLRAPPNIWTWIFVSRGMHFREWSGGGYTTVKADSCILVIGDTDVGRRVCSALSARGIRTLHLGDPTDSELSSALTPEVEGVAVMLHDDIRALRYSLIAEHLRPGIRLFVGMFDRTVRQQLESTVTNCVVLSPAAISVPTMVAAAIAPSVASIRRRDQIG